MSDKASIRITKDNREIFQDILLSLESSRPSKAEKDILDNVARHFGLPLADKSGWAGTLVLKGTSVEDLLDVVFRELRPFVLMVFDIYRFLSKMVSTTGGRTTHFEISADDKKYKLDFPDVDLPKRLHWINQWAAIRTNLVSVDWSRISDLLVIDSGIFYGRVRDVRLIQSLIIARRNGTLSPEGARVGKQIYDALLDALRAWWRGHLDQAVAEIGEQERWIASAFIPVLAEELVRLGFSRRERFNSNVGIDIEVILGAVSQYTLEDAFTDPASANVDASSRDSDHDNVSAALFFVALWGLDDNAFKRVAGLLTAHEDRDDLLRDLALDIRVGDLGSELINELHKTVVDTGKREESEGEIQRKIEILLLPYWKDRWFLYEVWTLTIPLVEAMAAGVHVELLGVKSISNDEIVGTNWNLPTQKAREPVARLIEPYSQHELLVWFQRETETVSGHIEPDIRITKSDDEQDDLLILECKDRVKFVGTKVERIARNYLDGSAAKTVWIVNYEDFSPEIHDKSELIDVDGRNMGFAYSFKPESRNTILKQSIRELFQSTIPPPKDLIYLVIDVSGSMNEKQLPNLDEFGFGGHRFTTEVYIWSSSVDQVGWERVLHPDFLRDVSSVTERPQALEEFAAALPPGARLVIVTDGSGKDSIENEIRSVVQNRVPEIAGHSVELILV